MKQALLTLFILFSLGLSAQTDSTFNVEYKVTKKAGKLSVSQIVTLGNGVEQITNVRDLDSLSFNTWKQQNLANQDSMLLRISKEIDQITKENEYIELLKQQNIEKLKALKQDANRIPRIREKLLRLK